jgi:hypothetical protein
LKRGEFHAIDSQQGDKMSGKESYPVISKLKNARFVNSKFNRRTPDTGAHQKCVTTKIRSGK